MSAPHPFDQPALIALHRGLVRDARRRPEYSTPEALGAYAEGVEHAIESMWAMGHRDVNTLIDAYTITGPGPGIHAAAQRWLAYNWPSLHNAVLAIKKEMNR